MFNWVHHGMIYYVLDYERVDSFKLLFLIIHPSMCSLSLQSANGLGLRAVYGKDNCQVTMKFPDETVSKWVCLFSFFTEL